MKKQNRLTTFLSAAVVGAALILAPAESWAFDADITAVSEGAGCIMVNFSNAQGGVTYGGIPTTSTTQAERILSLATAALLSGRHAIREIDIASRAKAPPKS